MSREDTFFYIKMNMDIIRRREQNSHEFLSINGRQTSKTFQLMEGSSWWCPLTPQGHIFHSPLPAGRFWWQSLRSPGKKSCWGKKKKEAQRDTRMSSQAKGGDKPSKLPLISRALMICQALCKVFTCMISINHCNSPALKKNKKPKQHFFLQMRKLGHREDK